MLRCYICLKEYSEGRSCPDPSHPLERLLPELLDGKYRLRSKIAKGGMSDIYYAVQLENNDEPCAIKILSPEYSQDQQEFERFRDEQQILSRLDHPNIVKILDFNCSEEGFAYFAMELLKGVTLKEKILREGRLAPELIAKLLDQICAAVSCAHRNLIVHRDLNPKNIILLPDDRIKVIDFGIAFTGMHRTLTGKAVGTPEYMSPEQSAVLYGRRRKPIDKRSDIFSLGITLYEMLTGHNPFEQHDHYFDIINAIHFISPELRAALPDIHEQIAAVVARAMEKQPQHRYQDILELASDFKDAMLASNCQQLFEKRVTAYQQQIEQAEKQEKEHVSLYLLYGRLGHALMVLNRNQQARDIYRKAIELESNYPLFYAELGQIYNRLTEYRQAIEITTIGLEKRYRGTKALSMTPDIRAALHRTRARAYQQLGELKQAVQDYEIAVNNFELRELDAYVQLGDCHLQLKDFKKVIESTTCALFIGEQAVLYAQRGIARVGLKEYQSALPDLKKALELNLRSIEVFAALGEAAFQLQNFKGAIEYYGKVIKRGGADSNIYSQLAHAYFQEKNFELAEKYYLQAIEVGTDNYTIYHNLATLKNRAAESFFSSFDNNHYELASLENYHQCCLAAVVAAEQSLKFKRRNLDARHNLARAYRNLADCYLKMDDRTKALQFARRALELRPDYAGGYYSLGCVLFNSLSCDLTSDNNEKLSIFGKARTSITRTLRELIKEPANPFAEATAAFQQAINLKETFSEPHYYLGVIAFYEEQPELAIDYFEKAARLGAKFVNLFERLGHLYFERERYFQAFESYQTAQQLLSKDTLVYKRLGQYYYDHEEYERAIKVYRAIIDLEPALEREYGNRVARCYYAKGRYQEACEQLFKLESFDNRANELTVSLEFDEKNRARRQFRSLSEAIAAAAAGDVINVSADTHNIVNGILLTKPITLIGEGMESTVIVVEKGDFALGFNCQEGMLALQDLTLRWEGSDAKNIDVLQVVNGRIEIDNCAFTGGKNDGSGIALLGNVTGYIKNCQITYNEKHGIEVGGESHPLIKANHCTNNLFAGIAYRGAAFGTALSNVCEHNRLSGIKVMDNAQPQLKNNSCKHNSSCGINYHDSAAGVAISNFCETNEQHGIFVKDQAQPTLKSNICQQNKIDGIVYSNAALGTASDNICKGNESIGIQINDTAVPILQNNLAEKNGLAGIAVFDRAEPILTSNICQKNKQYGIVFFDNTGGEARQNICQNNDKYGIYIEERAEPTLKDNNCKENGSGNTVFGKFIVSLF